MKSAQAYRPKTATAEKYPQGRFKPKPCRSCKTEFQPVAPSHLFCTEECANDGFMDRYYRRAYGVTLAEVKKMYEDRNSRCDICGGGGFTMKDSHNMKLVVDHCHATGKVRGLLCHNCNRALGLLQDSKESLKRALEYLEGATTIP